MIKYKKVIPKIKQITPWWAKIVGKIVLSRLPLQYTLWRQLDIFKHGSMLNPDYATRVFLRHYEHAMSHLQSEYSLLEFGPGDSLSTALLGADHGARRIWLVDAGAFAERDITKYAPLQEKLSKNWVHKHFIDTDEMLRATNTTYLTDGLRSLKTIPDMSVDFIFSQAVLEHVYLSEFELIIKELFRIQTSRGVASHRIDLRDHLGNSLNSLRFTEKIWESSLFVRSGFYTNRLRASQIIEIIQRAGYQLLDLKFDTWSTLPLDKSKLAYPFALMSDTELLIHGMYILLLKP